MNHPNLGDGHYYDQEFGLIHDPNCPIEGEAMKKMEVLVVFYDDHGDPVDPIKLLVNDRLIPGTPTANGWLFAVDIPEEDK